MAPSCIKKEIQKQQKCDQVVVDNLRAEQAAAIYFASAHLMKILLTIRKNKK